MAILNEVFDATAVEPSTGFSSYPLIPAGKYVAEIVQSEIRPTRDGNGQYIWLEFNIIDGECAGQQFESRLNIVNANDQAVQIARRELSAICHAVGVMNVTDTEQLHFKPLLVTLKVRPAKPYVDKNGETQPGNPSNEVGKYEAAGPTAPAPAQNRPAAAPQTAPKAAPAANRPATAPQAAPASTGAKAPPWRRG